MALRVVSSSTQLAAPLETVKRQARVIDPRDNDTITGYIKSATELIQTRVARQFVFANLELACDGFDDPKHSYDGALEIPVAPVRSTTPVVTYIAQGGTTYTTLSSTGYDWDYRSEPARLTPKYGTAWPIAKCVPNAVLVTFYAGYCSSSQTATDYIPQRAQLAIGQTAAHWNRNREAVSDLELRKVPLAAESLVNSLNWNPYKK